MTRYRFAAATALLAALALTGCDKSKDKPPAGTPPAQSKADEVAVERAKLAPADRALVEAQEWCAVNSSERLGSMGAPVKLDIKGQPVFICCAGCQRKAETDPDKTLAKVEELKAKAKGGK